MFIGMSDKKRRKKHGKDNEKNLRPIEVPQAEVEKMSKDEERDLKSLILSMKTELNQQIGELTNKSDAILNDLGTALADIQSLKKENAELKQENTKLRNDLCLVDAELKQQNERINQLEMYSRRENLVFYGIRQDNEEDCEEKIRNILEKTMEIEDVELMRFDQCHRMSGAKPQPIIIRFNWSKDRQRVWRARSKLKDGQVSMSEDFPDIIAQRRRSLLPIMKQARSLDHYAYLREDKLIIDRAVYNVDNLHTLPRDIDPANTATVQHGNVTAFYGGHSPLSNFHECKIVIDGKRYNSVEHYFQLQKCLFAEDEDATKRVHAAKSPLQSKRVGDSLTVDLDEWMPRARDVMHKAMKAKFTQNARAKNYLMKTGDSVLAEATTSKLWGSGLRLNDAKNGDQNEWKGRNEAGQILMAVRNELLLCTKI